MTVLRVLPEVFLYAPNNTLVSAASLVISQPGSTGGFFDYLCEVTDGTESQVETGQVFFIVNWNAIIQANISRLTRQQLVSAGTLETTWTITAVNPAVVSVTVVSSLTPSANYPRITYNIHNLGRLQVSV